MINQDKEFTIINSLEHEAEIIIDVNLKTLELNYNNTLIKVPDSYLPIIKEEIKDIKEQCYNCNINAIFNIDYKTYYDACEANNNDPRSYKYIGFDIEKITWIGLENDKVDFNILENNILTTISENIIKKSYEELVDYCVSKSDAEVEIKAVYYGKWY